MFEKNIYQKIKKSLMLIMAAVLFITTLYADMTLMVMAKEPIHQEGQDNNDGVSENAIALSEGIRITTLIKKNEFTYSGFEIRPSVKATCYYQPFTAEGHRTGKQKKVTLKENIDYVVTYENNVNAGTGKVIIKGVGNFDFEREHEFTIYKRNASVLKMSALNTVQVSGNAVDTEKRIKDNICIFNKKIPVATDDYYITVNGDTTKEGVVSVSVSMNQNGNYRGNLKKSTFNVKLYNEPVSLSENAVVSIKGKKKLVYDGYQKRPSVKVKVGNKKVGKKNYFVVYDNNVNAGVGTATVYGKNKLSGVLGSVSFNILPRDINKVKIKKIKAFEYQNNISYIQPVVKMGKFYLKENVDFIYEVTDTGAEGFVVSLKDSKSAPATLRIKPAPGNTNFTDENLNGKILNLKVKRNNLSSKLTTVIKGYPNSLSENSVSSNTVSENSAEGQPADTLSPSVTVMYLGDVLAENKDYTVKYKTSVSKKNGLVKVTATVKGTGLYTGKQKIKWIYADKKQ